MNIVKQPNIWSCTIAGLAMLLDVSFESLIEELGHDGSEIWFPGDRRPHRAFDMQEIVDLGIKHGVALVEIVGCPGCADSRGERERPSFEDSESRLIDHMTGNPGLITGYYAPDKFHLVAWDGFQVHDPMDGRVYSLDEVGIAKISVESFYRAFRIKS